MAASRVRVRERVGFGCRSPGDSNVPRRTVVDHIASVMLAVALIDTLMPVRRPPET